ncbi:hypothetical protein LCGC14_2003290, partial [marine sediment metagenome]
MNVPCPFCGLIKDHVGGCLYLHLIPNSDAFK